MQNTAQNRSAEDLPDPWLFDSEALLRELDRCREAVLQIPINTPNDTHLGIQIAVNRLWNVQQTLRYLLNLHREGQRAFRRKHDAELSNAFSQHPNHDTRTPARRANARHTTG
jgi:hypothetical protein